MKLSGVYVTYYVDGETPSVIGKQSGAFERHRANTPLDELLSRAEKLVKEEHPDCYVVFQRREPTASVGPVSYIARYGEYDR